MLYVAGCVHMTLITPNYTILLLKYVLSTDLPGEQGIYRILMTHIYYVLSTDLPGERGRRRCQLVAQDQLWQPPRYRVSFPWTLWVVGSVGSVCSDRQ